MKKLIYVALVSGLALTGCGENSKLAKPEFVGKANVVSIAESNWDKLLKACPGLDKYSSDLSYAGLSDWTYLGSPMDRVEVKFKIAEDPDSIPNSFNAWNHTCGFGISPDGKTLRIQKQLCVSVCQAKQHKGNGSDFVTDI